MKELNREELKAAIDMAETKLQELKTELGNMSSSDSHRGELEEEIAVKERELESMKTQARLISQELKSLLEERSKMREGSDDYKRISVEIDRIKDEIENGSTKVEDNTEDLNKKEFNLEDHEAILGEYFDQVESRQGMSSFSEDYKKISVEIDKIGAELSRNGIDTNNVVLMDTFKKYLDLKRSIGNKENLKPNQEEAKIAKEYTENLNDLQGRMEVFLEQIKGEAFFEDPRKKYYSFDDEFDVLYKSLNDKKDVLSEDVFDELRDKEQLIIDLLNDIDDLTKEAKPHNKVNNEPQNSNTNNEPEKEGTESQVYLNIKNKLEGFNGEISQIKDKFNNKEDWKEQYDALKKNIELADTEIAGSNLAEKAIKDLKARLRELQENVNRLDPLLSKESNEKDYKESIVYKAGFRLGRFKRRLNGWFTGLAPNFNWFTEYRDVEPKPATQPETVIKTIFDQINEELDKVKNMISNFDPQDKVESEVKKIQENIDKAKEEGTNVNELQERLNKLKDKADLDTDNSEEVNNKNVDEDNTPDTTMSEEERQKLEQELSDLL